MTQLTFADIDLNPSVQAADEERLHSQTIRLRTLFFARTTMGLPVSTIDMREIACQYNARLWELRRWLVKYRQLCIDRVGTNGEGVHYYKMVPIGSSTFYQQKRKRLTMD